MRFGRSRKKKLVQPANTTVTKYVPVSTGEDMVLRVRVEDYLKLAESEYARLYQEMNRLIDARDSGGYSTKIQPQIDRISGQMTSLHYSIALIKGTDPITESFQLDKKAYACSNEVFPMNSFFSQSSLMYPKVYAM